MSFFYSKKASSPAKPEILPKKQCLFFTQKDLPASQKTEILHEKMTKKGTKKSTQPPKNVNFFIKKSNFFTQKEHPASQKTEVLHEKKTKN